MAKPWAKYEVDFITHPKFRALNANAICLWIEGKNYCDSHMTDGLIPKHIVKQFRFSGRASQESLMASCGPKNEDHTYAPLWELHPVGFKMHDYLEYNDCREVVVARLERAEIEREKGRDYKRHARAVKKTKSDVRPIVQSDKPDASGACPPNVRLYTEPSSETETPIVDTGHQQSGTAIARSNVDPPVDRWFLQLKAFYPQTAVSSGLLTEQAFMDVVFSRGAPFEVFTAMLANLEVQKRGYQWRVKGMIPRLDKWLRDGLWEQLHEETPPSAAVNDKTAATMQAAAAVRARSKA